MEFIHEYLNEKYIEERIKKLKLKTNVYRYFIVRIYKRLVRFIEGFMLNKAVPIKDVNELFKTYIKGIDIEIRKVNSPKFEIFSIPGISDINKITSINRNPFKGFSYTRKLMLKTMEDSKKIKYIKTDNRTVYFSNPGNLKITFFISDFTYNALDGMEFIVLALNEIVKLQNLDTVYKLMGRDRYDQYGTQYAVMMAALAYQDFVILKADTMRKYGYSDLYAIVLDKMHRRVVTNAGLIRKITSRVKKVWDNFTSKIYDYMNSAFRDVPIGKQIKQTVDIKDDDKRKIDDIIDDLEKNLNINKITESAEYANARNRAIDNHVIKKHLCRRGLDKREKYKCLVNRCGQAIRMLQKNVEDCNSRHKNKVIRYVACSEIRTDLARVKRMYKRYSKKLRRI